MDTRRGSTPWAPWVAGGVYLNFAERAKHCTALFGSETHRQLSEVKAAFDPADVIRSNHPVPPAVSAGR